MAAVDVEEEEQDNEDPEFTVLVSCRKEDAHREADRRGHLDSKREQ